MGKRRLLEIRPRLVISASVFASTTDAYNYRFQDWPAWLREGLIDAAMPMDFSSENAKICFPRAELAASNSGERHVYLGLAGYMNTKENLLAQMLQARSLGLPGTVLYSYRLPATNFLPQFAALQFVKDTFQPEWTATPSLAWKTNRAILKGTVAGASGAPIYNAEVLIRSLGRKQLTEPHGAFAFFDLAPGSYEITARTGGRETAREARVEAGRILRLELKLPPP